MTSLSISIRFQNSKKLQKALGKLSGPQARNAYAQALGDTAAEVRKRMQDEMRRSFERPTRWTLNSVNYKVDKDKLSAQIVPSYYGLQGVDPQQVLQAETYGGPRRAKRSEVLLRGVGILPAGWVTVPGEGARIDANGNMDVGQIKQIISQLRVAGDRSKTKNMADGARGMKAQEKAGGRFFVIPPGGRAQPGVYQREFFGRAITPVLIFVRAAEYTPRLDLEKITNDAGLQEHLDRRVRRRVYDIVDKR